METLSIVTIITIAVLGSFGHCVGMCGGIVMAYSSTKIRSNWSKKAQAFSHLFYSMGRITTYVIIGAIIGFFGSVVTFNSLTNSLLLLLTGVMMILVGFSLLGKIKFLSMLEHSCSKSTLYQKTFKKLLGSDSLGSFYFLGALNGLLPCGFVYAFAIIAASTASAFYGAMVMLIFGLSTLPAMFSLGFFVGMFKQSDLRDLFIKSAAVLVLGFGVYMIFLAYQFYTGNVGPLTNISI
ncbi:sulfite exporter TauE/SafE family protein [Poseidonibacter lekithochrous]|uniref:sulfite exporter TauE/SafE family protein n=1 Tax=Poseidonibacter lekithochrous TaxID=1904463 RepID=UPI0008FC776A|nr:sulfite exporter TauE/SafE family protein [Poseidonibacter lekithochrous]QKJ23202.1 sulfite exporter TauE/SafE family protein (DsbD_2 domain) [Poseidonibacter lekithochrous]